ncbi:MAG: hypothetical protein DMG69_06070 [Acidobacteria bacterium]|nr:MAG: hypothetical protein DMG69_06070 [Acidobacteriota bacterium]
MANGGDWNRDCRCGVGGHTAAARRSEIIDAARSGKAIFCEKPISLTLDGAREMIAAVERAGVFFQMAFQRRFDAGYLAAKPKIEEGAIGEPVMFTSISRDPYAPPIEFCDPKMSGGLITDVVQRVQRVHAIGATLAYPEMKSIGDIDNAIIDLEFESGALGVVQLSRNAAFGYDIRSEIWGTKDSIQIGYCRQTPILMLTTEGITHDAVLHFMERFENAYLAQIQNLSSMSKRGCRHQSRERMPRRRCGSAWRENAGPWRYRSWRR